MRINSELRATGAGAHVAFQMMLRESAGSGIGPSGFGGDGHFGRSF